MGWIFFQRFDDRIIFLCIDHFNRLVSELDEFTNDGRCERFKSTAHGEFTITDIGDENFRCNDFLVEFLAELEVLGFIEKVDDIFVVRISEGTEKCGGQKFPATLAAIKVDVKEIAGVELHFNP